MIPLAGTSHGVNCLTITGSLRKARLRRLVFGLIRFIQAVASAAPSVTRALQRDAL
jgi:hypothetical protein